jgi:hypothetical protein
VPLEIKQGKQLQIPQNLKYYSILLDSALDEPHQERLSVVLLFGSATDLEVKTGIF